MVNLTPTRHILRVIVHDAETGALIPNAEVKIWTGGWKLGFLNIPYGEKPQDTGISGNTDEEGVISFLLDDRPEDGYIVQVTKDGYREGNELVRPFDRDIVVDG